MKINFGAYKDILISVSEALKNLGYELTEDQDDSILSGEIFIDFDDTKASRDVKSFIKHAVIKFNESLDADSEKKIDEYCESNKTNFSALDHKLAFVVEIKSILEGIFDQAKIKVSDQDINDLSNFLSKVYAGKEMITNYDQALLAKYDITEDIWIELYDQVKEDLDAYVEDMNKNFANHSVKSHENFAFNPDKFYVISDNGSEKYAGIEPGKFLNEQFKDGKLPGNDSVVLNEDGFDSEEDAINAVKESEYKFKDDEEENMNFNLPCRIRSKHHKNFSNFNYEENKFEDDLKIPCRTQFSIKNPRYKE